MTKKAIQHLCFDPQMASVIERIGKLPYQPRKLPSFQSLVQAVIHQQLNGKVAATILDRFCNLYEKDKFPKPEQVLETSTKSLRAIGLSRAKVSYVLDIAQKTMEGIVPSLAECENLSDEEIMERLLTIKGVGPWTAEMLLIFNMGRPDILPVNDLGIRKGFQASHRKRKLPESDWLTNYGKRWAPYRSTAALYLWQVADLLKVGKWG